MSEKWKTEKIGVTALCRISAKGGEGVYLYIPKNFADAYGVVGAEFAEVRFNKLFRTKPPEPEEEKKKVRDLTSRKTKNLSSESNRTKKGVEENE